MPTLSEMVQDRLRFLSGDMLPRLPLSASIRSCHEAMVERRVSGVVVEEDGVPLYLLSLGFLRRFIEAVKQKGVPPIGPHPASSAIAFEIAALLPIWSYIYLNLVDPGYLQGVREDGDPGMRKVIGLPFQDDPEREVDLDLDIEGPYVLEVTQWSRGWYFTGDVDTFNAHVASTDPPEEYNCIANGHPNKSWDRGICSNCPSRLA